MRTLLIAALAAFALSACTEDTRQSIDIAIQKNLPNSCAFVETLHVSFFAVAATGKVREKTIDKVEAAYSGIAIICADPAHTTLNDALARVGQAVFVISTAITEAKTAK